MTTYSVHLLSLRCIEAQELDGDETYIRFNQRKIWSVPGRYRMHEHPRHEHHFDEFDFVNGRLHEKDGWKEVKPFQAADFVFSGQTAESSFQIWEADFFTPDDNLGRTNVSANDIGRGSISVAFNADGARYILTYQVVADG